MAPVAWFSVHAATCFRTMKTAGNAADFHLLIERLDLRFRGEFGYIIRAHFRFLSMCRASIAGHDAKQSRKDALRIRLTANGRSKARRFAPRGLCLSPAIQMIIAHAIRADFRDRATKTARRATNMPGVQLREQCLKLARSQAFFLTGVIVRHDPTRRQTPPRGFIKM
jgi:hypothetical protein